MTIHWNTNCHRFKSRVSTARQKYAPLMAVASGYDPGITYQRISSEQPELFGSPPGVRPLDFYYDYATFRGKNGLTRLELYFGVPAMTLDTKKYQRLRMSL